MCIFSRFSETCIRIWGSMFLKIDWKYTYKVECIFWILNSENWPRIHIPVPVYWWHADCARRAHMQENSSRGFRGPDQAWSGPGSAQAISADLGPGGCRLNLWPAKLPVILPVFCSDAYMIFQSYACHLRNPAVQQATVEIRDTEFPAPPPLDFWPRAARVMGKFLLGPWMP